MRLYSFYYKRTSEKEQTKEDAHTPYAETGMEISSIIDASDLGSGLTFLTAKKVVMLAC
jgi:hypothetical protein